MSEQPFAFMDGFAVIYRWNGRLMKEDTSHPKQVEDFIREEIDTVPHLEALLLIWKHQPKQWTVEEMAHELYVEPGAAQNILQALSRRGLITAQEDPQRYSYDPLHDNRNALMEAIDALYRQDLIRLTRMIHSNAAPAIRDFAQAFRFTKDRK